MESFILAFLTGVIAVTLLHLGRDRVQSRRSRRQAEAENASPAEPADTGRRENEPPALAAPAANGATEAVGQPRAEAAAPVSLASPYGFKPGVGYPRSETVAALEALDISAAVAGLKPGEVDQLVIPRWKREGKSRSVFEILHNVARERSAAAMPGQTAPPRWPARAIIAGAVIVALALLAEGWIPRYEFDGRHTFDRWTGEVCNRSRCWNPRP